MATQKRKQERLSLERPHAHSSRTASPPEPDKTPMAEHNDYKVEKNRFCVRLFLLDGSTEEGSLYLSFHAANHEGPEIVTDVLNQNDQFLPINFREGATHLINKENIVMVAFPRDEKQTENPALKDVSVHNVAIHLMNHDPLEGSFFLLLPTHARRVKDYLNQEEPFLELRRDGTIYLINKDHILFVEEK
jgi:hypothetical protein